MEMSRFLYEVRFFLRAQFVGLTLPRCPDVNANHPIERNYGNSVRFLAKIPNGTAAESPCYSVICRAYFGTQLISVGCRPKKISMHFASKSRFFTRNVPLKTFSRLAGLSVCMYVCSVDGFSLTERRRDGEERQRGEGGLFYELPFLGIQLAILTFPI